MLAYVAGSQNRRNPSAPEDAWGYKRTRRSIGFRGACRKMGIPKLGAPISGSNKAYSVLG